MKEREYDRKSAVKYARKWVFDRNLKYYKNIRFIHLEKVRFW